MTLRAFIRKYSLWILLFAGLLTVAGDYLLDPSSGKSRLSAEKTKSTNHSATQDMHDHSEDHESHDHSAMSKEAEGLSKEEREKRMGIFHYNEANAFLKKGQYEESVVHYKMALHHASSLPEIHLNLSTAFLRLKEYDKAMATLTDLEKIAPNLPALHYNLACYHSLTGDMDEALKKIQQAVKSGIIKKAQLKNDPDLEALRQHPAFILWLKSI